MDSMRTRENILGVRLAPDERALIKAQAEREGRTDSGLVRHIVLSHLRTSNERAPRRQTESAPVSTTAQP